MSIQKITMTRASLFLALWGMSAAAMAATVITVNTVSDAIASDGQCSCREAVQNANNHARTNTDCALGAYDGTDIIMLPVGTITLTSDLTIAAAMTLSGAGVGQSILDGNSNAWGIQSNAPADLTLADLNILNFNASSSPFGIYAHPGTTLTAQSIVLSGSSQHGIGAIQAVVNVSDSSIENCTQDGISLGSCTATIQRSTVTGNQVWAIEAVTTVLNLTNDTFDANKYGIYLFGSCVTSIDHCSVSSMVNMGVNLGDSSLTVQHSIFYGSSPDIELVYGSSVLNSLGHNVIGNVQIDAGGTYNTDGSDISSDPLLQALAANGGVGKTRALGAGSPAIDYSDASDALAVDERGTVRPTGTSNDVGAFELLIAPSVTALSFHSAPISGTAGLVITGTSFAAPLTVTVNGIDTTFVIDSPTQITADAPAGAAGSGRVIVSNSVGASADTAADDFTVTAGPIVVTGSNANGFADVVANDGYCSCREAILNANAGAITGGRIKPGECGVGASPAKILLPAASITLVSGNLAVTATMTLSGLGAGSSILDGSASFLDLNSGAGTGLSLVNIGFSNLPLFINGSGVSLSGCALANTTVGGNPLLSITGSTFNIMDTVMDASNAPRALWVQGFAGTATMQRSTLTGASTHDVDMFGTTGSLVLRNDTIDGPSNGLLLNTSGTLPVTIDHCTIVGGSGGNFGIAVGSGGVTVTLSNSVVFGATTDVLRSAGAVNSSGYNVIGTSSGFVPAGTDIATNPNLAALGNNGGITLTRALPFNSVARNMSNPADPLAVDQRGSSRPTGAANDAGAYELAADSTPPSASLLLPTPSSMTATTGALISAQLADNIGGWGIDTSSITMTVDGQVVAAATNGVSVSFTSGALVAGVHTVTLDFKDLAGNAATKVVWSFQAGTFYCSTVYNYNPSASVFDFTFGGPGSGNGKFSNPGGIGTDSLGFVYVADISNNRVEKFDGAGNYQAQWGSGGSGNGQFNAPNGLAVDANNVVYVADGNNNRIQKFSASGAYLGQWGSAGSAPGQFSDPQGLAAPADGFIYVADYNNVRIQKFTPAGAFVAQFAMPSNPAAVAVDSAGNIYVSFSTAGVVNKYSPSGAFILNHCCYNSSWPLGVSVDRNDNLYIGEFGSGNIFVFNPANVQTATISSGNADRVAFGGGHMYSPQYFSAQVARFSFGTPVLGPPCFPDPTAPSISSPSPAGGSVTATTGALITAHVSDNTGGSGVNPASLSMTVDGLAVAAVTDGVTVSYTTGTLAQGSHTVTVDIKDLAGNASNQLGFSFNAQPFFCGTGGSGPLAYVSQFGSPGGGNGQFSGAFSITFDGAGNIYVLDRGNDRIQKFSPSGVYASQWSTSAVNWGLAYNAVSGELLTVNQSSGRVDRYSTAGTFLGFYGSNGSGDGQFQCALAIATDASGNFFVTDQCLNRVQKFSPTGVFLAKWGSGGNGNGQFNNSQGIAVGPNGDVYVADSANNRVEKFDNAGTYLSQWGTGGGGNGQFNLPTGIATDAAGQVYVCEVNNQRLQRFDSAGTFIDKLGTGGSGNGQFNGPYSVAVLGGNIFVSENSGDRVQKFSGATSINCGFDATAPVISAPSPLPGSLTATSGALITAHIADSLSGVNLASLSMTVDGLAVAAVSDGVTVSGTASAFTVGTHQVTVDIRDNAGNQAQQLNWSFNVQAIFCSGSGSSPLAYVSQFGTLGGGGGQFNFPVGSAVDGAGNIYVVDRNNGRIEKFSGAGTFVSSWSPFITMWGMAYNPVTGELLVVNQNNQRIERFSSTGINLGFFGSNGAADGQFINAYGIAVDASGNFYVTDVSLHRVQKFSSAGAFLAKWGSGGNSNGQFNQPYGVAVSLAGDVYVADSSNNRIQKFTSGGSYVTQWGNGGSGNGQFSFPISVAVDGVGQVYVSDANNSRIQRFDSSGTFVDKSGSNGSGNGQFSNAYFVMVSGPNVFVSDSSNNRLQKLSGASFLNCGVDSTPPLISAASPVGLTASSAVLITAHLSDAMSGVSQSSVVMTLDGATVTAATDGVTVSFTTGVLALGNHTVTVNMKDLAGNAANPLVFSFNAQNIYCNVSAASAFSWISVLATAGNGNGQVSAPTGVARDSAGNVYVADRNNSRIQKFDSNGVYLTQWASTQPWGIAWDPTTGNILVANTGNQRIDRYSNTGTTLGTIGSPGGGNGQFSSPTGVAVDSAGNIFVSDQAANRVQKFNNAGSYLTQWGSGGNGAGQFNACYSICVNALDQVYVAEYNGNRVQKFSNNGTYILGWGTGGNANGQFNGSLAVSADPAGNVYVSDAGNSRIQRFDATGTFVDKFGSNGGGVGQFSFMYGVTASGGFVFVCDTNNNRVIKLGGAANSAGCAVDTTAPSASSPSPAPSSLTGTATGALITAHLSDLGGSGVNAASVSMTVDGVAVAAATDGVTVSYTAATLAVGLHQITVDLRDNAGNQAIQLHWIFTSQALYCFSSAGTPMSYNSQFGSGGGGNGQFNTPMSAVVDGAGNIYVADRGNNRIEKFSPSGVYVSQWSTGFAEWGLAYNPATGELLVVNQSNQRIERYSTAGTNLGFFGSSGSGTGQFNGVYGIAVDSAGNFYTTEVSTVRVQKFSSAGSFLTTWGSSGGGNGQFNNAFGIAVSSTGFVYVADGNNNRVQKFSNTGTYLGQWGSGGNGNGQFNFPSAVAVDGAGQVYVMDQGNNRVQRFDAAGTFVDKIGAGGNGSGQFSNPYGIMVTGSSIYVPDTFNNRLQKFDGGGISNCVPDTTAPLASLPSPNGLTTTTAVLITAQLSDMGGSGVNAASVSMTVDGVAVAATTNGVTVSYTAASLAAGVRHVSVDVKDNAGNAASQLNWDITAQLLYCQNLGGPMAYASQFGSGGGGNGQFNFSAGAALDGAGNIYVVDRSNNRVEKFTPAGVYSSQWNLGFSAWGMAFDAVSNELLVANQSNGRVERYSTAGTNLGFFGSPGNGTGQFNGILGIATDSLGNFYTTENGMQRVQKFSSSGAFLLTFGSGGGAAGQFNNPYGIAVNATGDIYVADASNNRIQKFNSAGTFVSQWGTGGSGNGQFGFDDDVAVDSSGQVYVVDQGNNRVQRFDSSGTFIDKIGTAGSGNGQFSAPNFLVIAGANIYVSDSTNNRVEVLSGASFAPCLMDATAPSLSLLTPTASSVLAYSNPVIAASVTDSAGGVNLGSISMTVDGQAVAVVTQLASNGSSYTVSRTATALGNGVHMVTLNARDNSGNAANQLVWQFTVTTDTSIPVATLLTPTAGSQLAYNNPVIAASLTDPAGVVAMGSITMTVDGASVPFTLQVASNNSSVTISRTATSLANGLHTVTVNLSDVNGNAGQQLVWSFSTTNDPTPPTATNPIPAGASLTSTVATLSAVVADNAGGSGVNPSSVSMTVDGVAVPAVLSGGVLSYSPPSPLSVGLHHVTVDLKDLNGNAATQLSWSFESRILYCGSGCSFDFAAPTITSPLPSGGSTVATASPVVQATISDATPGSGVNAASISVTVDGISTAYVVSGSTLTISAGALSEGVHVVSVDAKDNEGNAANPLVWSFSVHTDSVIPVASLLTPVAGSLLLYNNPVIAASITDPAGVVALGSITMTVDGAIVPFALQVASDNSSVTVSHTATALADGMHTATLSGSDLAGNAANQLVWQFRTHMAQLPIATLLTPTAASTLAYNNPVIAVSVTAPAGTVEMSSLSMTVDGASVAFVTELAADGSSITVSKTAGVLSEGSHSLTMNLKDTGGFSANQLVAHFVIHTDSIAPVASLLTPTAGSLLNYNNPVIAASITDPAGVVALGSITMTVDGTIVPFALEVASDNSSVTVSRTAAVLAEGLHTVTLNGSDVAGNAANQLVWHFTIHTDSLIPVATLITPTAGSLLLYNNPVVAASITDPAGVVALGSITMTVDGAIVPFTLEVASDNSSVTVSKTASLLPDGLHTATLSGSDMLGNAANQLIWHFTTHAAQLPIATLLTPTAASTLGYNNPVIAVSVTAPAGTVEMSSLSMTVDGSSVAFVTELAADGSSITVSKTAGVLSEGSHTLTMNLKDTGGASANQLVAHFVIHTDSVIPVATLLTPTAGSLLNYNNPVIAASITDPAGVVALGSITMTVDGAIVPFTLEVAADNSSVTVSRTAAVLAEGLHTVTLNGSDWSGNAANQLVWHFTVHTDSVIPVASLLTPTAGSLLLYNNPVIAASITDPAGVVALGSITMTVDGAIVPFTLEVASDNSSVTVSKTASVLADGNHTATLSGNDWAGNAANQLIWHFKTHASQLPIATLLTPTAASTLGYNNPVIAVSVTAPAGTVEMSSLSMTVDGASVAFVTEMAADGSSITVSNTAGALSEGSHTLTMNLKDSNGFSANQLVAHFVIHTDSVIPVATLLTPTAGSTLAYNNPVIAASITDPAGVVALGSITMTVDGTIVPFTLEVAADNSSVTVSNTASVLANGLHTVTVHASDWVGNAANVLVWHFNVNTDSTAPIASSPSPAGGSVTFTASPLITAHLEDNAGGSGVNPASVSMTVDGLPVAFATDGVTVSFTATAGFYNNGSHVVTVGLKDNNGNAAAQLVWHFTIDASNCQGNAAELTSWNVGGSGLSRVAVDSQGHAYVGSFDAGGTIYKYDSDGILLGQWASTSPVGVGVDLAGNVYTVDSTNQNIHKYDGAGNLLADFSSVPLNVNPGGIAIDAAGFIYVANQGAGAIQKLDASGNLVQSFGPLPNPIDVAVAADGSVYASGTVDNKVYKFKADGTPLLNWDIANRGFSVALDGAGYVYVSMYTSNRVDKFNSSGAYVGTFGGASGFNEANGIDVDKFGQVYAISAINHVIHKFSCQGPDSVAPVASLPDPAGSSVTTTASPIISAQFSDLGGSNINPATAVFKLDGVVVAAQATTASAQFASAGLSDGLHHVTVDIKDNAGNAASQLSWQFTVQSDLTSPVVTAISAPTAALPVTVAAGSTLDVTYSYTEAHPSWVSITVQSGLSVIGSKVVSSGLLPNASNRTDSISLSSTAAGGSYDVVVTVVDLAGNTGAATELSAVVVDRTAPTATFEIPVNASTEVDVNGNTTISLQLADLGGSTVNAASIKLSLDGAHKPAATATYSNSGLSVSYTASGLSAGVHTVSVDYADLVGNAATKTWSFTMVTDNTAPVVTAISAPTTALPVTVNAGATVNVSYSYDEVNPSYISITVRSGSTIIGSKLISAGLIGGLGVTRTDTVALSTLAAGGNYDVQVVVTDLVALSGMATNVASVVVDKTAPTATLEIPVNASTEVDVNGNTTISLQLADLGGSTVNAASVKLSLDGVLKPAATALYSNSGVSVSYTASGLSAGVHTVSVDYADLVGNSATKTWSFTMVTDNTAPVVTAISAPTTALPVTVNAGATVNVSYSYDEVNPSYISITVRSGSTVIGSKLISAGLIGGLGITRTDTVALSTLAAGGNYDVQVVVTDMVALSGMATNVASVVVDKTAPTATLEIPLSASTEVDVNGNTTISLQLADLGGSIVNAASVKLSLDGVLKPAATATVSGSGVSVSYTASGLSAGVHTVSVDYSDLVGNAGLTKTWSFTMITDNTAPVVTAISAPTTALPVTVNAGATVNVSYSYTEVNPSYLSITVRSAGTVIGSKLISSGLVGGVGVARTDTVDLSTLAASGSYDVQVVLVDMVALSGSATNANSVIVDRIAPTASLNVPTGIVVDVNGNTTVTLQLADTGGSIVNSASVKLYLDGVLQPSATATASAAAVSVSYTASSLSAGSHTISVDYSDAVGNAGLTQTWSFTMVRDVTPPLISVISAPTNATPTYAHATGTVDVSYTYTEVNPAYISITVKSAGSVIGQTVISSGLVSGAGISRNDTVVIQLGALQGSYDVLVGMVDMAGLTHTVSTLSSVIIDNTAPVASAGLPAGGSIQQTASPVISAALADAGGSNVNVASERMTLDGQVVAAATAAGSISFNTSNLADGPHTVTVDLKDRSGNSAIQYSWTFRTDVSVPSVALTDPLAGAYVRGIIPMTALATDSGSGVSKTAFFYGATQIDTSTFDGSLWRNGLGAVSPNSSVLWDTTALADGVYTVKATATDLVNNVGTSGVKQVTIDNTLPIITINAPFTPTQYQAQTITGSVTEANLGVIKVNGVLATVTGSSPNYLYQAVIALTSGANAITVTASDLAGNGASLGSSVTFDPTAPVHFLTPLASSVYKGTVAIEVAAPSVAYSVRLEVSRNSGATWNDFSQPAQAGQFTALTKNPANNWQLSWDTVLDGLADANGAYQLRATAFDQYGTQLGQAVLTGLTVDNIAPVSSFIMLPAPVPVGATLEVYQDQIILQGSMVETGSGASRVLMEHTNASNSHVSNSPAWLPVLADNAFSISTLLVPGVNNFKLTAYDVAGNSSFTTLTVIYKLPQNSNTICAGGGTVAAPDGTSIVIPGGALTSCINVSIIAVPRGNLASPEDPYLQIVGYGHQIDPSSLVFQAQSVLTLPYTNADLDPDADGTPNYTTASLKVIFWDGSLWQTIGVDSIDTVARRVTVRTNHLGVFALAADTAPTPQEVKVSLTHNPFRFGSQNPTAFSYQMPSSGRVTIRIFDITGNLVRNLVQDLQQPTGRFTQVWDGLNNFSRYVGTGTYLYRFEAKLDNGQTVVVTKAIGVLK